MKFLPQTTAKRRRDNPRRCFEPDNTGRFLIEVWDKAVAAVSNALLIFCCVLPFIVAGWIVWEYLV